MSDIPTPPLVSSDRVGDTTFDLEEAYNGVIPDLRVTSVCCCLEFTPPVSILPAQIAKR